VAALDPRVSAVALIAGGYNLTDTYVEFLGEEGFAQYLGQMADTRQRQFQSGEVQYMPAIAGLLSEARIRPGREAVRRHRRVGYERRSISLRCAAWASDRWAAKGGGRSGCCWARRAL